jgi:hypothetical protein
MSSAFINVGSFHPSFIYKKNIISVFVAQDGYVKIKKKKENQLRKKKKLFL